MLDILRVIDDHGEFAGLGDEDHTQYLLTNGTRAGASSQAQTMSMGVIGPWMTPDVVAASFAVPVGHTAVYNGMQVPGGVTVSVAGLLVDPAW